MDKKLIETLEHCLAYFTQINDQRMIHKLCVETAYQKEKSPENLVARYDLHIDRNGYVVDNKQVQHNCSKCNEPFLYEPHPSGKCFSCR